LPMTAGMLTCVRSAEASLRGLRSNKVGCRSEDVEIRWIHIKCDSDWKELGIVDFINQFCVEQWISGCKFLVSYESEAVFLDR